MDTDKHKWFENYSNKSESICVYLCESVVFYIWFYCQSNS